MMTVNTEIAAGNPTAPLALAESSSNTPLERLEQLLAAHERQGAFLETIGDKLEIAIGMAPGDRREAELQNCRMILLTGHEIHDRHFREMGDIVAALFAERRERRAAA